MIQTLIRKFTRMKIPVLFFVLIASMTVAQESTWIEARGKAGFLIAHRSVMGHLATEHAVAAEVSWLKQCGGERDWHKGYKYPTYGVTAFVGTTGNRALLGYQIGAYSFIRLPIVRIGEYTLSGKMAAGLSYGTRVYDPSDSTLILSMAISSHINALICMGVESRFVWGDQSLVAGLDMTHFSNGASKVPNYGLNVPYLSLGYGYQIKNSGIDTCVQFPERKPYWEFGAIGIGSFKQVDPVGGKTYPFFGLDFLVRRNFKRNSAVEVSFDIFSKQAIFAHVPEVPKTQSEIIQLGLFTGYLMRFNRLHAVIGMGYYVRDKFKSEDFFYHRVGLRYVFKNGINANLVLKSHWARADYVEYGIGYTFKR